MQSSESGLLSPNLENNSSRIEELKSQIENEKYMLMREMELALAGDSQGRLAIGRLGYNRFVPIIEEHFLPHYNKIKELESLLESQTGTSE